jgi:Flp pilus assembly protein TadD
MLDAGEFGEAEPMLRRAHEWDPGNAAITAELGFALSQQKRDSDAIALYDAAIARGGSGALLKFNRGNCHVRSQRFAEAANDFRACVELKADWHDARVNLVSALLASNDKAGAQRELAQLKQLGGNPQHVAALEQMLGG